MSAKASVAIVDSEIALLTLLDGLTNLPVKPPSLFIDFIGTKLGRQGTLSILTIYVAPTKETHLVDIQRLEQKAFSTTNKMDLSLKSILESPTIPKVVFDVRNASDALFKHYQISVDGIKELQLMELAVRNLQPGTIGGSQKFLFGLAKCVANQKTISAETKEEWCLMKGQSGGLQLQRPLQRETIKYCERHVAIFPRLYKAYNAKLGQKGMAFWRVEIRCATKNRVVFSQSSTYDGNSKDMAIGPWTPSGIEEERDSWNEEIILEARLGEWELNDDDEWVKTPTYDFDLLDLNDEYDAYEYEDDYADSARDCMGWEEDMIKNGEFF